MTARRRCVGLLRLRVWLVSSVSFVAAAAVCRYDRLLRLDCTTVNCCRSSYDDDDDDTLKTTDTTTYILDLYYTYIQTIHFSNCEPDISRCKRPMSKHKHNSLKYKERLLLQCSSNSGWTIFVTSIFQWFWHCWQGDKKGIQHVKILPFTGGMGCLTCPPTVWKDWREKVSYYTDLLTPSSPGVSRPRLDH